MTASVGASIVMDDDLTMTEVMLQLEDSVAQRNQHMRYAIWCHMNDVGLAIRNNVFAEHGEAAALTVEKTIREHKWEYPARIGGTRG